jgi:methyltransferase-like protein
LDVDSSFGKFDYIICHGVYSWVSHEVQRKILDIGLQHLTAQGVLYVSYNTYPGWHLRGVVREMMRYHVADFDSPQTKIRQARGLLDFLVKYAKSRSQTYAELLKDEAKMLEGSLDSYIYHEHLEEINEPLYFNEFVKRVDAAGLRYLADAHISSMVAQLFDEEAAEILRGAPLLRREQYMDFLRSRMFRSSLLCRQNVEPNYTMPSGNLLYLHAALGQPLRPTRRESGQITWQHPSGTLTTEAPITAVIERLNAKYPAWMSIRELYDSVPEEAKKPVVLDALLMGFVRGMLQLSMDPVDFCDVVTQKPTCTPYARMQAKKGNRITSRMHNDWVVQPQQRFLIEHMDGTRTAEDLSEMLRSAVGDRFKVTREGSPVSPDASESLQIIRSELERLRILALLVG